MLSVTTSPQGLIAFLLMLWNTGTQLTWHCRERETDQDEEFIISVNSDHNEVVSYYDHKQAKYLEAKAYGGHCIENCSPGSRTVKDTVIWQLKQSEMRKVLNIFG